MKIKNLLFAFLAAATLTGCGLVTEEGDDTNCGLFVAFKYDYNLQRADMFKDHVGGVTLYVFDKDGKFIKTYENNNVPAMGTMVNGEYLYCMHIQDLPDGEYRFIALCNQKAYNATLVTQGPKYRRTNLSAGDPNEALMVALDREDKVGNWYYVNTDAPMDTLWHGMTGSEAIKVDNHDQVVTTISLVRDTKMLTIGLHNLDEDERANIDTKDFEYYIIDDNGILAYNNDLLADDTLVYKPFRTWNSYSTDETGVNVTDATAHACITFNRLIWDQDPRQ